MIHKARMYACSCDRCKIMYLDNYYNKADMEVSLCLDGWHYIKGKWYCPECAIKQGDEYIPLPKDPIK